MSMDPATIGLANAGREGMPWVTSQWSSPGCSLHAMGIKEAGSHSLYAFTQKSSMEFKTCG